jgi:hypothetical protein
MGFANAAAFAKVQDELRLISSKQHEACRVHRRHHFVELYSWRRSSTVVNNNEANLLTCSSNKSPPLTRLTPGRYGVWYW